MFVMMILFSLTGCNVRPLGPRPWLHQSLTVAFVNVLSASGEWHFFAKIVNVYFVLNVRKSICMTPKP